MWLCEGKLKVKIAHFRLASASQKRACLSSLMASASRRPCAGNLSVEETLEMVFNEDEVHRGMPSNEESDLG